MTCLRTPSSSPRSPPARVAPRNVSARTLFTPPPIPANPKDRLPALVPGPKSGGVSILDVAVGSQTLAHASYCPRLPGLFSSTSLYSLLLPLCIAFVFLLFSSSTWGCYSTVHCRLSFFLFVFSLISCIESSRECDLPLPVSDVD